MCADDQHCTIGAGHFAAKKFQYCTIYVYCDEFDSHLSQVKSIFTKYEEGLVQPTATTYCNVEISLQKFTSPASPASPQSSVLTNGWRNAEPGDIRMGYHDELLESLQQCVAVISSVVV